MQKTPCCALRINCLKARCWVPVRLAPWTSFRTAQEGLLICNTLVDLKAVQDLHGAPLWLTKTRSSCALCNTAAETVAVANDGALWTADKYGALRRAAPAKGGGYEWDPTPVAWLGPGRPLGFELDAVGDVIVCMAGAVRGPCSWSACANATSYAVPFWFMDVGRTPQSAQCTAGPGEG